MKLYLIIFLAIGIFTLSGCGVFGGYQTKAAEEIVRGIDKHCDGDSELGPLIDEVNTLAAPRSLDINCG